MTDLKKTQATVAELMRKRDKTTEHWENLSAERSAISYAALAENDEKAKRRLEQINADGAKVNAELESIDAAIRVAKERVQVAEAQAQKANDRDKAKEVRKLLVEALKLTEEMDKAFEVVVAGSSRLRDITYALNAAGCGNPNHSQVNVLGALAVRTFLGRTIWNRDFELVPPPSRTSFGKLMSGWAQAIERNIRTRLGEPPLEADHAA